MRGMELWNNSLQTRDCIRSQLGLGLVLTVEKKKAKFGVSGNRGRINVGRRSKYIYICSKAQEAIWQLIKVGSEGWFNSRGRTSWLLLPLQLLL